MEIIFSRGTYLLSRLIMWVQGFPYSHMALRYPAPDADWLVQSELLGVYPDWADFFFREHPATLRYRVKFDPAAASLALDNTVKAIGHKSYDFLGLAGDGLVILLARVGLKIRNPFNSASKYFCSEVYGFWAAECNRLDPTLKLIELDTASRSLKDINATLLAQPGRFERIL